MNFQGKLNNTIIIITSDHGDFNKGKSTNYDAGTKVPLMMYWPDGITTPSTYDELVQNIDFAPTFLDLAGGDLSNIVRFDCLFFMMIYFVFKACIFLYPFFEELSIAFF